MTFSVKETVRRKRSAMGDMRRFSAQAVTRKIEVWRSGLSRVSATCQISDLRSIYERFGFNDRKGIFVEVGGFDGESFSNTSFLADQGWRGIYVEPIPMFARQIRYRHFLNDVKVEELAITDKAGSIEISVMGALTTISGATEEAYRTIDWAKDAVNARHRIDV